MTEIIDHEPDPKNSQHVRNRHLTDLADTIVQALNDTPECWEIVKDGDAHMNYVRLTPVPAFSSHACSRRTYDLPIRQPRLLQGSPERERMATCRSSAPSTSAGRAG